MAHRKAGGSAKNLRDSNPKYLGIKINDKQPVKTGQIIVRQRGTRYFAGSGVGMGKDHTLFSLKDGCVSFSQKRKKDFTGKVSNRKFVKVEEKSTK